MMTLTAIAPAKLNLFLHITGRRENGYHELQSLFTPIDICDNLRFSSREDGAIHRANELPEIAYQDDLTVKAALLLQKQTNTPLGATIELNKKIPSGAGLGGGSSDAATTLIALNKLWNTGLSEYDLAQLGLILGADVPFFIFGQPALVKGIGEQLQPFPLTPIYYLVIRPQLFISTAEVFSHNSLCRNSPLLSLKELHQGKANNKKGMHFARNDLEPVAFAMFPALAELIGILRHNGFELRMTGSGSCFFIPYEHKKTAEYEKQRLKALLKTQTLPLAVESVFLCRSLEKTSVLFYTDN